MVSKKKETFLECLEKGSITLWNQVLLTLQEEIQIPTFKRKKVAYKQEEIPYWDAILSKMY